MNPIFSQKKKYAMFLLIAILFCSNTVFSKTSVAFISPQHLTTIPRIQQQEQLDNTFALHAKKKKGGKGKGKGKGQKKQSGFEWAASFSLKPFEAKATRELASTACASFEGRTGKPLATEIQGSADIPKSLWNAPVACVVVSSTKREAAPADENDVKDGEDPNEDGLIIKYANLAALETVGLKPDEWDRFIAMPDQAGTPKLPENPVAIDLPSDMKGDIKYASGYSKKIMRGKEGGDATTIINGHRWSIEKSSLLGGKFVTQVLGVAYAWEEWLIGEDIVCRPGGVREERLREEDIEESIEAQAASIRDLKEVQGFGNKDQEVVDAVQELMRLKSILEDLKA